MNVLKYISGVHFGGKSTGVFFHRSASSRGGQSFIDPEFLREGERVVLPAPLLSFFQTFYVGMSCCLEGDFNG